MISAQTARRAVWRPLWQLPRRFDLIVSLTRRELAARYRGSVLGIVWAILTPIVMIAIRAALLHARGAMVLRLLQTLPSVGPAVAICFAFGSLSSRAMSTMRKPWGWQLRSSMMLRALSIAGELGSAR